MLGHCVILYFSRWIVKKATLMRDHSSIADQILLDASALRG
jgi:hypothetical protein